MSTELRYSFSESEMETRTGVGSFVCDRPRRRSNVATRLRSWPLFIIEAAVASKTNSARKGCREAAGRGRIAAHYVILVAVHDVIR